MRSESVVVPKDVRETQSLNEVWLKVQGRFNQDHQDIGRATKEVLRDNSQVFEGVQEEVEVKPMY